MGFRVTFTPLEHLPEQSASYRSGYDCGFTLANEHNAHFTFFGTHDSASEWQAGYGDGCADRYAGRDRACEFP
jgi:hypothetical protein